MRLPETPSHEYIAARPLVQPHYLLCTRVLTAHIAINNVSP
jgi:hypothetical protein